MDKFDIGETVVLSIEVRNSTGGLANPATSMLCQVYSPNSTISSTYKAMSTDSTGKYHLDWASASKAEGTYTVYYKATDNTRITIKTDKFKLE